MAKKSSLSLFVTSVVSTAFAAVVGSLATVNAIPTWYIQLRKPPFVPPNYVFGIVWTMLYACMVVALYLFWKKDTTKQKNGVKVFYLQLFLNALWSIVFFGLHSLIGGVVVILFLLGALAWTIYLFAKKSKIAGAFLVPYFLWVCFATYLTVYVFLLNK